MLRPNSQPRNGFETGRPASNPSTRFEAGARVVSASLARRSIEQYYHAPFLHECSIAVSEVLRAMAFSLRRHTLLESV